MSRPTARRRGYDTAWEKARAGFLERNPWCVYCITEGRQTPATVVDHREPHRGDRHLFWDRHNWQPLCRPHHDSAKAREEKQEALR